MTESVTYIRVNMNGKWTNLGIIAESEDLKEHFWFVQGLLEEKERADRYENMWNELYKWIIDRSIKYKEDFQSTRNDSALKRISTLNECFREMQSLEQEDNQ